MHLFAKISPATTRFFALSLSLLAVLGPSLTPARAEEPRIALAGSASPASALRQAHLLGRLDANTSLRVGLVLPLRHQSRLTALVRRQYTPGDALFHHFLTPADFTAQFGPTPDDYDAVAAYARSQGLSITEMSPGRTLLNVAGPSARIEAAFGVQMSRYRLPSGRLVFSNSAAPRLPRSVAVRLAGIAGLSNAALMHPHLSRMTPQHLVGTAESGLRSNAPVPITTGGGGIGSGPLGGLSPNDIKFAYGLSAVAPLYGPTTTSSTSTGTLTGAGQNIGLFELDGYLAADISQYVTQFNLPTITTGKTASVTNILLGGFSGTPLTTPLQGGQTEVTLDIDMILALAPAATGVYVYEDDQTTDAAAPITIFTRMANDLNPNGTGKPLLQVISCSWGVTESVEDPTIISEEDTLFQQMAAQGQSIFCSSGDNGAYDLYTPTTTTTTTTTIPAVTSPAVDNPASQPFVTGVGGTTLSYQKPATNSTTGVVTPGSYVGEIVWSAGTPAVSPEGSGGGVSSLWSKPSYQQGFGSSPTRRDVPDVSLNADPNTGYTIFVGSSGTTAGTPEVIGGTSAAAPLWAAYTALVNQQRTANGQSSVGFMNPVLYPIAAGASYATDFHDIVSGTNLFYSAGTGYDDATGLGSFVGASLLASLSSGAGQSTGTGTLSGTVTDLASPTTPIVGATVSATTTATGAVAVTTTTDATGAYTLTVPSGIALTVTVSTTGITSPTTTNYLGTTVTVPALAPGGSTPQNFELSAAVNYSAGLQMISAPFDYSRHRRLRGDLRTDTSTGQPQPAPRPVLAPAEQLRVLPLYTGRHAPVRPGLLGAVPFAELPAHRGNAGAADAAVHPLASAGLEPDRRSFRPAGLSVRDCCHVHNPRDPRHHGHRGRRYNRPTGFNAYCRQSNAV